MRDDSDDEVKAEEAARPVGEMFAAHREQTLARLSTNPRRLTVKNKWKHGYWTKGSRKSWNSKFYGESLCCRQMSKYFIENFDRRDPKSYHRTLGSKEAIDRTNLPLNRFDKEKICFRGDRYIFSAIEKNGLGKALHLVCQGMAMGDIRRFLLSSENHMMAVVVVYEEPEKYSVHFYDPNSTKSHQIIECRDTNQVKSLRLAHFLSEKNIHQTYFPVLKSLTLIFYNNPRALRPYDESGVLESVDRDKINNTDYIQYALLHGLTESVEQAVSRTLNQHTSIVPIKTKTEILRGCDERKVTALNGAISEGHVQAPIAFCRLILEAPEEQLPYAEKQHLLHQSDTVNCRPLVIAIIEKHIAFAQAFIKLVLETAVENLTRERKKQFVLAMYRGAPAIHQAMKAGNTDVALAYARAIIAARHSSIGVNTKRFLLEAKRKDGKSAIDVAIDAGHLETARAYSKVIGAYVRADRPELLIRPRRKPIMAPEPVCEDEDVGGFSFPLCVIS
ncbi:MAG: ShET2/EspL2 family type III secretion system effector toxin [Coxiellaceae bacterium]|nr:ShET2/EspL2 family type III secretion system effector toxin [Coxiellaceae bacterium]